jgi:hypothetical protein
MEKQTINRHGTLNVYEIAGLAIAASAIAAATVLVAVRRMYRGQELRGSAGMSNQPAIDPEQVPQHFSEDLIIPGFTQTGAEIADEDARDGRSHEGV